MPRPHSRSPMWASRPVGARARVSARRCALRALITDDAMLMGAPGGVKVVRSGSGWAERATIARSRSGSSIVARAARSAGLRSPRDRPARRGGAFSHSNQLARLARYNHTYGGGFRIAHASSATSACRRASAFGICSMCCRAEARFFFQERA